MRIRSREEPEYFRGYGVLGLPFASGHVLAVRRFVVSSIGPAYSSVWHRAPDGSWTMWVDVEASLSCPRYFGRDVARVERAPIAVECSEPRRVTVRVDEGRVLDWDIRLAATPATRCCDAVAGLLPAGLWRRRPVLSALAAATRPLLRAGRLSLHGHTSNGQWFRVNPKRIWLVTGGRAVLRGADLAAPGPLAEQAVLGGFRIPRRGLFAAGEAFFGPSPAEGGEGRGKAPLVGSAPSSRAGPLADGHPQTRSR
jgi:hypothetical protein